MKERGGEMGVNCELRMLTEEAEGVKWCRKRVNG